MTGRTTQECNMLAAKYFLQAENVLLTPEELIRRYKKLPASERVKRVDKIRELPEERIRREKEELEELEEKVLRETKYLESEKSLLAKKMSELTDTRASLQEEYERAEKALRNEFRNDRGTLAARGDGQRAGLSIGFFEQIARVRGAQMGAYNEASYSAVGLQAGIDNVAENLIGIQAGLVNVAKDDMRGIQIGLVCYANKGRYLQIGLVTLRKEQSYDSPWYIKFTPFIGFRWRKND